MKNFVNGIKTFCENSKYIDRSPPSRLKTVLYKSTCKKIQAPENILNYSFVSKPLYMFLKVSYNLETINVKLDDTKLKVEYLRKRKDSSDIVKKTTSKHVATSFTLGVF